MALLIRGMPFFFVGGRSDMACPKADALSTRCPNFPTVESKVSSLGKLLFLPWKFHFPRLESFWKHVKKIRFITFFHLADLTKLAKLPRKSGFVREETKNLHGGGI